jgi:Sigma-70 factor, region 1.1
MENKTKATPQKEVALQQGPEIPDALLPLLDLSDAAVTKLINEATKRGYVTYEQLNAVLPLEEVTSEQIEDILRRTACQRFSTKACTQLSSGQRSERHFLGRMK